MNKRVTKSPLSKEEISRGMEVSRKKIIVKDNFYPALVKATVSVDEAKMLIQSISTLMMEDVLQTMKERKFSELKDKLVDRLCKDGERKEEVETLLATLESENLFVAREIVEGMSNAIEQMILDEMQARNLDTLSPDWERMLNR